MNAHAHLIQDFRVSLVWLALNEHMSKNEKVHVHNTLYTHSFNAATHDLCSITLIQFKLARSTYIDKLSFSQSLNTATNFREPCTLFRCCEMFSLEQSKHYRC